MPRRRVAIIATVAGVLFAVGVPVSWTLWHRTDGMHQVGRGTAADLGQSAPPPSPAQSSADRTSARATTSGPRVPYATPGSGGAKRTDRPVRLRISTIGVIAPVVPVGVDAAGAMVIPEQVSTLGWYQYSSPPGASAGSMVIAGHIDSARQGLGVLFRLRDVPIGARIELTGTSGKIWDYRVIAREEFAKTTVPLSALFSHYGQPRLSLITCGGAFNAKAHSYEDNIVVTAVPT